MFSVLNTRSVEHGLDIVVDVGAEVGGVVLFLAEFGGGYSFGVGQELDGHDPLSELAGGEILHVVTTNIHVGQVHISVGCTTQERSGVRSGDAEYL